MKLIHIAFRPIALIVFTPEEMDVLMQCSASHYDSACKFASRPGGFLYGMKNGSDFQADFQHSLTWQQLDTLAKIVEVASCLRLEKAKIAFGIGLAIRRIFNSMEELTPDPIVFNAEA